MLCSRYLQAPHDSHLHVSVELSLQSCLLQGPADNYRVYHHLKCTKLRLVGAGSWGPFPNEAFHLAPTPQGVIKNATDTYPPTKHPFFSQVTLQVSQDWYWPSILFHFVPSRLCFYFDIINVVFCLDLIPPEYEVRSIFYSKKPNSLALDPFSINTDGIVMFANFREKTYYIKISEQRFMMYLARV